MTDAETTVLAPRLGSDESGGVSLITEPTAPSIVRSPWVVLASTSLAVFAVFLDTTILFVAFPAIGADFSSVSQADLSWVLNGYTLAFGGLLLLGGRLGDVRGRLRTFEAGLALFVFASLMGGLAPTTELLIGARALQGVGAAMAAPSVLALLTTGARDDAERNRALALFGAVSSGGASRARCATPFWCLPWWPSRWPSTRARPRAGCSTATTCPTSPRA